MTRTLRRLARLAIVALGPPPVEDYRERYEQARADIAAARKRYRRLFDCEDGEPVAGLMDALACEVESQREQLDGAWAAYDASDRERGEARRARDIAERDVDEMAALLSRMRAEHAAEVERLREALRPFAALSDLPEHTDGYRLLHDDHATLTLGDLRRAHIALSGKAEDIAADRLTPPPDRITV